MTAYIGTCRTCGTTVRVDDLTPYRNDPDGNVRRLATLPAIPCPNGCHRVNGLALRYLKARTVAAIPCGPKCQSAKGPSCDCSCGGANHGSNYAALSA